MSQVRNQNSAPQSYHFSAKPETMPPQGKYRNNGPSSNLSRSREFESSHKPTIISQRLEQLSTEDTVNEKDLEPYYYVDKAPPAEYIPMDKGIEVSTQIEDHELFDFELEVIPVIEVLAGRCLEEAQIEIDEEVEKSDLEKHKIDFEIKRNAELMVTQRMEAEFIRFEEEKERRKLQYESMRALSRKAHMKFVQRSVVKASMQGFKSGILRSLYDLKFLDEQKREILNTEYVPVMVEAVKEINEKKMDLESQLNNFLFEAENSLKEAHRQAVENEMERRKMRKEQEIQEKLVQL